MSWLDIIDGLLNLAGLLLWLKGWGGFSGASSRAPAGSLLTTLKRAAPAATGRWLALSALFLLLLLRSAVYWQIGPGVDWAPRLHLGAITLGFRSDFFARMLLFSGLSFLQWLGGLYLWLLLFSIVNHYLPDTDPYQKRLRQQVRWIDRWPILVKLLLPLAGGALLWGLLNPALVQLGLVPPPKSTAHLAQQALVIGAVLYLYWKFLLAILFLLHLVGTYVFLGHVTFWNYVNLTARKLLWPLRWLRFGRVDFAPAAGIVLVFVLAHFATQALARLYQRLPL